MKSSFSMIVRIRLYKIVICVLLIATAFCTFLYFHTQNPKYEGLLAGLATGLIVALVQYLLDWNEHSEIETIKKLGILQVLPHRDDKAYYQPLLADARREILVLGNTASRFFEDFAHETRADSQTLLTALSRGVHVRILLPSTNFLKESDKPKATVVKDRMKKIAEQYQNFEFRFFNHAPANSLVKIDDHFLFGPIFSHISSKDSPTIHATVGSSLVAQYLRHIEDEWANASKS
jgi:hypothetical protein